MDNRNSSLLQNDFDSMRYARDGSGADQYQMQNGYGLGGYNAGTAMILT
jgi:hypothetical protein